MPAASVPWHVTHFSISSELSCLVLLGERLLPFVAEPVPNTTGIAQLYCVWHIFESCGFARVLSGQVQECRTLGERMMMPCLYLECCLCWLEICSSL
jgi:hypothetical protein